MGTLFCVGLQRLDEQSDIADMEDGKRDSLEYMSCPSDSRYVAGVATAEVHLHALGYFVFSTC